MNSATSSNTSAAPIRILLVDDNQHGLIARKTVLEELGYLITPAREPWRRWSTSQTAPTIW